MVLVAVGLGSVAGQAAGSGPDYRFVSDEDAVRQHLVSPTMWQTKGIQEITGGDGKTRKFMAICETHISLEEFWKGGTPRDCHGHVGGLPVRVFRSYPDGSMFVSVLGTVEVNSKGKVLRDEWERGWTGGAFLQWHCCLAQ